MLDKRNNGRHEQCARVLPIRDTQCITQCITHSKSQKQRSQQPFFSFRYLSKIFVTHLSFFIFIPACALNCPVWVPVSRSSQIFCHSMSLPSRRLEETEGLPRESLVLLEDSISRHVYSKQGRKAHY